MAFIDFVFLTPNTVWHEAELSESTEKREGNISSNSITKRRPLLMETGPPPPVCTEEGQAQRDGGSPTGQGRALCGLRAMAGRGFRSG